MNHWTLVAEGLESSYKKNGVGWKLYDLVATNGVKNVAEIGCYQGYSTIYLAAALNAKLGSAKLEVFDAWDWYQYRHCRKEETIGNVRRAGFGAWVKFTQAYAEDVPGQLTGYYDLIHVDISNDGETLKWAVEAFREIIRGNGLLILEGGSIERDRIDWMIRYNKTPMNPIIQGGFKGWLATIIQPFPSITILRRI